MQSLLTSFPQLIFFLPDILTGASLISLIVFRSFFKEKRSDVIFPKLAFILSTICLIATLPCSLLAQKFDTGFFVYSSNLSYMKNILLAVFTFGLSILSYAKKYKTANGSFFVTIFGFINSAMLCLSASNFLALLLGLELYTFSLIFILFLDKKDTESRKFIIKFLFLSSIMTAVFLFGCSLLYSQFGSLSFSKFDLTKDFLSTLGAILILCSILFKLGGVPFHFWLLEIYEKFSIFVVLLLDAVWKFFMFFIFIRVFHIPIFGETSQYRLILSISGIVSMIFGAVAPIFQKNIARFIATASIGHLGFLMTVFAVTDKAQTIASMMSYLAYYSLSSVCFFSAIILAKKYKSIRNFSDISGISNEFPYVGFLILLSMFSMIGVPPFGSFFAKFDILKSLIQSKNYTSFSFSILHSLVSVFYVAKWSKILFESERLRSISIKISNFIPRVEIAVLLFSVFAYDCIKTIFLKIINGL
ncbi:MAG: hypothetical protein LBI95_00155 [Holosporales bacterium]|jgi:NADH-quinone oxidoreductase subunit N|nr:hypothetical protein [Holosporales bacterium]